MNRALERVVEVWERATHQAEGCRARAISLLERPGLVARFYTGPADVLADLRQAREAIDEAVAKIMDAWPQLAGGGKAAA